VKSLPAGASAYSTIIVVFTSTPCELIVVSSAVDLHVSPGGRFANLQLALIGNCKDSAGI
jgi:hypothetical protein